MTVEVAMNDDTIKADDTTIVIAVDTSCDASTAVKVALKLNDEICDAHNYEDNLESDFDWELFLVK